MLVAPRAAWPPDATAFLHRRAHFVMNVHTRWRDPAEDQACIDWARRLFGRDAVRAGTAYVNFMPDDETAALKTSMAPAIRRLAEIKLRKYDPGNMFRINQNIRPAP